MQRMIHVIRRGLKRKRNWLRALLLTPVVLFGLFNADMWYGSYRYQWPVFPDHMPDPRLICHHFDMYHQAILLATVQHQDGVHDPASIRQMIEEPYPVQPVRSSIDPEISRQMNDPVLRTFRLLNSIRLNVSADAALIAELKTMAATTDLYEARLFEAAFVTQGEQAGQLGEVSLEVMYALAEQYGVEHEKADQDWVYQSVRLHGPSPQLLEQARLHAHTLAAYADACSLVPVSQVDRDALAAAVFASPELEDDVAAVACLLGTQHPRRAEYLEAMLGRFIFRTPLGFGGIVTRTGQSMASRLYHKIRQVEHIPRLDQEGMQAITQLNLSWFETPTFSIIEGNEYKAWLLYRYAPALAQQWVTYSQRVSASGEQSRLVQGNHMNMDKILERYRERANTQMTRPKPAA